MNIFGEGTISELLILSIYKVLLYETILTHIKPVFREYKNGTLAYNGLIWQ